MTILGLIARSSRPVLRNRHPLRTLRRPSDPHTLRPLIPRCSSRQPLRTLHTTPRRLSPRTPDKRDPRDDDDRTLPHYSHLPPNSPEYHAARVRGAKPLVADDFEFSSLLGGRDGARFFFALCVGSAIVFYLWNREEVPITGRWRFNYLGDMRSPALEAEFRRAMEHAQAKGMVLPEGHRRTRQVRRVLERLIPVSGLKGYDWEVYVVKDDSPNAVVLPGGKVLVHSGLFPLIHNDDDLAVVLGHEIAHCIAHHHGERASGALGPQLLVISTSLLAGYGIARRLKSRFAAVGAGIGVIMMGMNLTYNIGTSLTTFLLHLPMSRDQEAEADYIGIMIAAEACYNPEAALRVWPRFDEYERMQEEGMLGKGARIPEWMKTHPNSLKRYEKFREWMPRALEKRYESDCQGTSRVANQFWRALRTPRGRDEVDVFLP